MCERAVARGAARRKRSDGREGNPGPSPRLSEERANFLEESRPRRLALEQHVVATFERNEPRVGNERGELATELEWTHAVATRVEHERGHVERRGLRTHIDVIRDLADAQRVLHGHGAREIVEPLVLL